MRRERRPRRAPAREPEFLAAFLAAPSAAPLSRSAPGWPSSMDGRAAPGSKSATRRSKSPPPTPGGSKSPPPTPGGSGSPPPTPGGLGDRGVGHRHRHDPRAFLAASEPDATDDFPHPVDLGIDQRLAARREGGGDLALRIGP